MIFIIKTVGLMRFLFIFSIFIAFSISAEARINNKNLEQSFSLIKQGKVDEAFSKLKQCSKELERYNKERAVCQMMLGEMYLGQKKIDSATAAFRENYLINKKVAGKDSAIYGLSMSNMGRIRKIRGELGKAIINYRVGNRVLKKFVPKTNMNLAVNYKQLAEIYAIKKDFNKFTLNADNSLKYFKTNPQQGLPMIAAISNSYSQILMANRQGKKAVNIMQDAVNIMGKYLKADNAQLKQMQENLAKAKASL